MRTCIGNTVITSVPATAYGATGISYVDDENVFDILTLLYMYELFHNQCMYEYQSLLSYNRVTDLAILHITHADIYIFIYICSSDIVVIIPCMDIPSTE